MEYKVKTFTCAIRKFEKPGIDVSMNSWFYKNTNIEIIDIRYSIAYNEVNEEVMSSAILVYVEKT